MKSTTFLILVSFISATNPMAIESPFHLYSPHDKLEILDINNFDKKVENSSTALLVEFYSSWCGDCKRFAPLWKRFASEIQPWADMIKVGVVACSDEINSPLCRKYKVNRYPTVKYFHENYKIIKHLGKDVVHDEEITLGLLKEKVDKILLEEQNEGRGHMFPNLQPFSAPELGNLFEGVDVTVQFILLIVEKEKSYNGLELALDFHDVTYIAIRYALSSSPALSHLRLEELPVILVLDRTGIFQIISNIANSKYDLKVGIQKFLHDRGIPDFEVHADRSTSPRPVIENPSIKQLREYVKKMGDVIFQIDLEAAVRYSLKTEIATVSLIKDKQLQALNNYLKLIKDHFPFVPNNTFINKLTNLTFNSKKVEGVQIERLVQEAEETKSFSSPQKFLGCRGSSPNYKGYPCSLWRLFHFLSVNYAIENLNNTKANPKEALNAIHGYVKHFFGCKHCSEHFQKMALERNMANVSTMLDSVLWLWKAHNVVNARLKGDVTEDPEYPKIQWPSIENCHSCYNEEGEFLDCFVLEYLEKMYWKNNVRYIGSDTNVLFPGLRFL